MKIVEKMKDENLGMALIYNFTKGYAKPVPMDLYEIVLPLLYHDDFRDRVLQHHSLHECILACVREDSTFQANILQGINDYQTTTSKAMGMAMVQHAIHFQVVDQAMCGEALDTQILDLNEAKRLGEMCQMISLPEIYSYLQQAYKKIVVLQSASVGDDMDVDSFANLGELVMYEETQQDEIRERIRDAHIVVTNKNVLDESVLHDLDQLELICLFATGTNNIDLDYCRQHHIRVANVKGYSTNTVAQHTLALLMHLVEKNVVYDTYVKSKEYTTNQKFSYFEDTFHDIAEMTWGIVGLGDIGKKVAEIATAMGAHVQYYSTSQRNDNSDYAQVDFQTLLKTSDIISIHAPLNQQTHYLFNEEALRMMKKQAYLINVGRGGIIEEHALVKVMNEGHLGGAGLDVFEHEPLLENDIIYQIEDMSRVILTPHIAWGSFEARQRCVQEVYKNIQAFLKGESRNSVNSI